MCTLILLPYNTKRLVHEMTAIIVNWDPNALTYTISVTTDSDAEVSYPDSIDYRVNCVEKKSSNLDVSSFNSILDIKK